MAMELLIIEVNGYKFLLISLNAHSANLLSKRSASLGSPGTWPCRLLLMSAFQDSREPTATVWFDDLRLSERFLELCFGNLWSHNCGEDLDYEFDWLGNPKIKAICWEGMFAIQKAVIEQSRKHLVRLKMHAHLNLLYTHNSFCICSGILK